jgi:hypothetical protein
LVLTAGGDEAATAQDRQRPMFAGAIGRPFAVTVVRNGALNALPAPRPSRHPALV